MSDDQLKVLIVDDSKPICMMVQAMLEESNAEVFLAHDGQEGLQQVDIVKPDVVLLDWNMPVLDGPGFLEQLSDEKKNTTKVIMMTTENKPEFITKAISLGAVEYMFKPFTSDILFEKINFALGVTNE